MPTRLPLVLTASAGLIACLSVVACTSNGYRATSAERDLGRQPAAPAARADRDGFRRDLRSGTLTAGHFDDGNDPERFADWADEVAVLGEGHGFVDGFDQPAIQLNLYNEHGDPIHNASVELRSMRGNRGTLRSGTDGRCVVLPGYDGISRDSLELMIETPGRRQSVQRHLHARPGDVIDIEIPGAVSQLPEQLDLALVIDTTGSMGDELEYLKVEFRAIVERIAERFPHVDQRWAVVVYRDHGDAYVVREYDFTSSIGRVIDRLGDQSAGGGGDYPEAVDEALQCAADLRWRDGAAKAAFLIADAPPHADRADDAIAQASAMRAEGVALYPVASSGVKAEAEHLFRAAALMTGGGYSFLTDDSGVGNPHAEPHDAPAHSIQRLDDLIVQLVESELMGESRTPRQRDIVRNVPEDGPQQHRRATAQQLRDWEERRDTLVHLLDSTELSAETADAIEDEIAMLDRRLANAGR